MSAGASLSGSGDPTPRAPDLPRPVCANVLRRFVAVCRRAEVNSGTLIALPFVATATSDQRHLARVAVLHGISVRELTSAAATVDGNATTATRKARSLLMELEDHMRGVAIILATFVAGCGSSGGPTQVGTTSTPPNAGSDGGVGTPTPGGGTPTPGGGGTPTPGGGGDGGTAGSDGGGAGGSGGGTGGTGGSQACTLTAPTKLASSHLVTKIIVDGSNLYFLDVASAYAGLYRMPTTGGTPTLVANVRALQNDGAGWDFALDDTTIYLTFGDGDMGPNANGVRIIDKASGVSRYVPAIAHGCNVPVVGRLAPWGGTVWLLQHNYVPYHSTTCTDPAFDTIEVIPAGASQPQTLTTLYHGLGDGVSSILADQTHVFWGGIHGTRRELHDGSGQEFLASLSPSWLLSDGNTLFASVGESVYAITAPGQYTAIYQNSTQPFYAAQTTAIDDKRVYVATDSGVVGVDKDGANPHTVVDVASPGVSTVAVDATNIYYFTSTSVMTACK